MRTALTLFLLLPIVFTSCKEAEKYEKPEAVEREWAGQYLLIEDGEVSRLKSLRYILSPDGTAERHLLRRSSRWSDYSLEDIRRGSWSSRDASIQVRFGEGNSMVLEHFDSIAIRRNPRDTTLLDTVWVDSRQPDRVLKRLVAF